MFRKATIPSASLFLSYSCIYLINCEILYFLYKRRTLHSTVILLTQIIVFPALSRKRSERVLDSQLFLRHEFVPQRGHSLSLSHIKIAQNRIKYPSLTVNVMLFMFFFLPHSECAYRFQERIQNRRFLENHSVKCVLFHAVAVMDGQT